MHVALSESERALYDAVRAATLPEVVAKLARGRQRARRARGAAAPAPGVLPSRAPARARQAESSAKLEALVERLEVAVADGHKALVFSQWTSLLDLVEPALGAAGLALRAPRRQHARPRRRRRVVRRRRTARRCC